MTSSEQRQRTLAEKLNHLFATVAPHGRGPYSNEEAAQAITLAGEPISGSYLWLLRKGQRDNPTLRHLEALAKFFGVPPAYFFDDETAAAVDADLALLIALKDLGVREVALRTAGLAPESLAMITEVIERVRQLEGLPASAEDSAEGSAEGEDLTPAG
ncbi:XRE family transcriptional regulator [Actinomadura barringtoniae]|uniref:XRE family transcriptional regulator n=1 Tax=Actinomadura barringtoniae TaxID=1427535 RepID=A0A939PMN6_9ACTN|nr:XRE family transcriptional regulator [Actinomadura barringtoniae]MBO2455162.1 XRE family transcriptional regulator [Actinomadura barringtoniae]